MTKVKTIQHRKTPKHYGYLTSQSRDLDWSTVSFRIQILKMWFTKSRNSSSPSELPSLKMQFRMLRCMIWMLTCVVPQPGK